MKRILTYTILMLAAAACLAQKGADTVPNWETWRWDVIKAPDCSYSWPKGLVWAGGVVYDENGCPWAKLDGQCDAGQTEYMYPHQCFDGRSKIDPDAAYKFGDPPTERVFEMKLPDNRFDPGLAPHAPETITICDFGLRGDGQGGCTLDLPEIFFVHGDPGDPEITNTCDGARYVKLGKYVPCTQYQKALWTSYLPGSKGCEFGEYLDGTWCLHIENQEEYEVDGCAVTCEGKDCTSWSGAGNACEKLAAHTGLRIATAIWNAHPLGHHPGARCARHEGGDGWTCWKEASK